MTSIPEFYGRWAALYDAVATAPGIGRWRVRAAERVAREGDTVVEMGCGTGVNLPYLRQRVGPDGRVIGVDITGPLLERARERAGHDNVTIVQGDATRPPIEAADAVLATFVCGLFEEPAAAVDQWCALVRPGGRVGLLDATASDDSFGRPLNPLFRAFVAAGAPDLDLTDALLAPFDRPDASLSRRVEAARRTLVDRTIDRSLETFGLGFVGLSTGRVADGETRER
jgi:ubiquinone/menaquinone biosynthesis C-methylase UbiE